MLPLARFSPPCSPPLSFGNTPRLFIVGVCLNFMDHLELTRVKWSSVVPGWVPRQDILPTSREACLVTFHQRRSFLTPKALIPLGLIYISSAWLTLLFSLYRQTGNVANFNSVLRSSTSHRPMGTQPASPLRTAFPPRRSRLVVLQCGVWHHRSNPQRSYAPWRLCECDHGSVSEISSYAQQTMQISASAQQLRSDDGSCASSVENALFGLSYGFPRVDDLGTR